MTILRFIVLTMLLYPLGCGDKEPANESDVDTDTDTDTDTDSDTDADTDTDTDTDSDTDVDSTAEGRTGTTLCAAGGAVEGDAVSGSFCFGPVDISSAPTSSSANYTWQAGPFTPISP